jgi:hypothetical protein
MSTRLVQSTVFGIVDNLNNLTDFAASAAVTYSIFTGDASFPKYTSKYFALPVFNRTDTAYVNASLPVTFEAEAIHSLANCEFSTITSTTHPSDTTTTFMASGAGLPKGCHIQFHVSPETSQSNVFFSD